VLTLIITAVALAGIQLSLKRKSVVPVILHTETFTVATSSTSSQLLLLSSLSDNNAWKMYSDVQNGFAFHYPPNYRVSKTFSKNSSEIVVSSIVDIDATDVADGACGSQSPEILTYEKIMLEENPVGTESSGEGYSIDGKHKIVRTAQDTTKALLSIMTCQGLANDNDSADTRVVAEIFHGNMLIVLELKFPFNADGQIKVRDISVVADQLMNGEYAGHEQKYVNDFSKVISTLKFTAR
jgi:hypothetical protein